jgi:hypothetical protein
VLSLEERARWEQGVILVPIETIAKSACVLDVCPPVRLGFVSRRSTMIAFHHHSFSCVCSHARAAAILLVKLIRWPALFGESGLGRPLPVSCPMLDRSPVSFQIVPLGDGRSAYRFVALATLGSCA